MERKIKYLLSLTSLTRGTPRQLCRGALILVLLLFRCDGVPYEGELPEIAPDLTVFEGRYAGFIRVTPHNCTEEGWHSWNTELVVDITHTTDNVYHGAVLGSQLLTDSVDGRLINRIYHFNWLGPREEHLHGVMHFYGSDPFEIGKLTFQGGDETCEWYVGKGEMVKVE